VGRVSPTGLREKSDLDEGNRHGNEEDKSEDRKDPFSRDSHVFSPGSVAADFAILAAGLAVQPGS